MLNYRDYEILLEIVKHCQRIQEKIKGISLQDFLEDEDLKEIICFNLLQIGELVKNFTDDFIKTYTRMPWKQIKGMRNKVVHEYGTLDLDLIYNTSLSDINDLLNYCQEILSNKD